MKSWCPTVPLCHLSTTTNTRWGKTSLGILPASSRCKLKLFVLSKSLSLVVVGIHSTGPVSTALDQYPLHWPNIYCTGPVYWTLTLLCSNMCYHLSWNKFYLQAWPAVVWLSLQSPAAYAPTPRGQTVRQADWRNCHRFCAKDKVDPGQQSRNATRFLEWNS